MTETPQRTSRARTIIMMMVGGFILAFGGCALFLGNLSMNSDNALANVGAIGFIAGILVFIAGAVWALARWIDRRFAKANQP